MSDRVTAPSITEFLLARIGEDEAAANAATGTHWHGQACEVRTIPEDGEGAAEPYWFRVAEMTHSNHFQDTKHIALHDPARVLAECAAKRAIVEWGVRVTDRAVQYPGDAAYVFAAGLVDRQTQYLAAVYATHPDYRQEWVL